MYGIEGKLRGVRDRVREVERNGKWEKVEDVEGRGNGWWVRNALSPLNARRYPFNHSIYYHTI